MKKMSYIERGMGQSVKGQRMISLAKVGKASEQLTSEC